MLRRQGNHAAQLRAGITPAQISAAGSAIDALPDPNASVVFGSIMRAAQDAADVYLENIKNLEAEKTAIAEKLEQEQERVEKIEQAYGEAERKRAAAEEEAKRVLINTKRFLDWHSTQIAAMQAGFNEAVQKMGMSEAVFGDGKENNS